jgi:7-carboxy-7-deazaguanine synthase
MSGQTLRVFSTFGPTFQGEGPACGQLAAFIRLAGCGVGCIYCDERQTWDPAGGTVRTVGELRDWALGVPADLVVITGGEPLAQRRPLASLAVSLAAAGRRVHIETSGTIAPGPELGAAVSMFVVSPKLANSGVPERRRIRPEALAAFTATGKAVFKFVACDKGDLDEVAELAVRFGLAPVWIMPEGVTAERQVAGMRELAEETLRRGWNLTGRMHVLLWEGEPDRLANLAPLH